MDSQEKIIIAEFGMLNTSTSPDYLNGGRPSKNVFRTLTKRVKVSNMKRYKNDPYGLEFDLVGVDPSFANALRRLMISEVPSMAIEKVFIYGNSSIIQVSEKGKNFVKLTYFVHMPLHGKFAFFLDSKDLKENFSTRKTYFSKCETFQEAFRKILPF